LTAIADLADQEEIGAAHLVAAIQYGQRRVEADRPDVFVAGELLW
jgi:hypothetical protein